jgi:predicted MFS family arabinose efflux permease
MTASPPTTSPATRDDRSLWRRPELRRLAGLTALGFASFFLTLSAGPSWAVRGGVGESAAGLVTAAMLLSTVAVQAAVPALERRFGTPALLAAGLVALGAPAPLYAVSAQLGWLLALATVRGAGFAVLTVLGALLSSRLAPPGRQGEAVGIYGLSIAVPNLVAVPAGAALTAAGQFGWVAALAASPLLAVPLVRSVGRAAQSGAAQSGAAQSGAAGPGAGRSAAGGEPAPAGAGPALRAAAPPSLVLLVVTLSGGGLVTFLPIARPHGGTASLALLLFGVTGSASRWWAGVLSDRVGRRRPLTAVLGAGAAGLAAVAAGVTGDGGRVALLFAGAAVFGVAFGATQNLTQLIAFDRAGPRHLTAASAIWNGAFDAGTAIGAYGVGLVAASGLELRGTYLVCAALVLAVVPIGVGVSGRKP